VVLRELRSSKKIVTHLEANQVMDQPDLVQHIQVALKLPLDHNLV